MLGSIFCLGHLITYLLDILKQKNNPDTGSPSAVSSWEGGVRSRMDEDRWIHEKFDDRKSQSWKSQNRFQDFLFFIRQNDCFCAYYTRCSWILISTPEIFDFSDFAFSNFQNLENSRIENYAHRKSKNQNIKKFRDTNQKLSAARAKHLETTILIDRKLNPMDGISR